MKFPEHLRITEGEFGTEPGSPEGCFRDERGRLTYFYIASDDMGWEHVSLSIITSNGGRRMPTWDDMSYAKGLFWEPEEAVMQIHPPASQYVDFMPNCLHLWRPSDGNIPLPPSWMVGPRRAE